MLWFWLLPVTVLLPVSAGAYEIRSFEAEEPRVYSREFKKVEIWADVQLAPGEPEPKLNLVEVNEAGDRLRFRGILLHNSKKKRWVRRVELLEREPRKVFFEIVPEAELEPFQKKSRPRTVIEVLQRPSLIDIIKGIFTGGERNPSGEATGSDCLPEFPVAVSEWKELPDRGIPAGSRGLAAPRKWSGKEEGVWAAIRATVDRPLAEVRSILWDPSNLKNMEKTRLKIEEQGASRKRVSVQLRPVLWITLDWTEIWELSEKPVRISYRKLEGDNRLRHFCGRMELERVDDRRTQVTIYEELDAPRRSPEDVLSGHIGTIRRILSAPSS